MEIHWLHNLSLYWVDELREKICFRLSLLREKIMEPTDRDPNALLQHATAIGIH